MGDWGQLRLGCQPTMWNCVMGWWLVGGEVPAWQCCGLGKLLCCGPRSWGQKSFLCAQADGWATDDWRCLFVWIVVVQSEVGSKVGMKCRRQQWGGNKQINGRWQPSRDRTSPLLQVMTVKWGGGNGIQVAAPMMCRGARPVQALALLCLGFLCCGVGGAEARQSTDQTP